jgi:hypothetical protein
MLKTQNVSVKTIRPKQAQAILERSMDISHNGSGIIRNRPYKRGMVEFLVGEILSGNWREDGSTITLDKDGRVIDGQHRLRACVESNTPIRVILVSNVDTEDILVKDTGHRRTTADTIHMIGMKNRSSIASALNRLWAWQRGNYGHISGRNGIKNYQVLDYFDKHHGIERSCAVFFPPKILGKLIRPSVGAAMDYIITHHDGEMADKFWKDIETGENLSNGGPTYVLRRALVANMGQIQTHRKIGPQHLTSILFGAWNAFVEGKEMHRVVSYTGQKDMTKLLYPDIKDVLRD